MVVRSIRIIDPIPDRVRALQSHLPLPLDPGRGISPEPGTCLVLIHDGPNAVDTLAHALSGAETWQPIIAYAEAPTTPRVVAAMRAGALDYLDLPFTADELGSRIAALSPEIAASAARRRESIAAARSLASLSKRERDVLTGLTRGCSSKEIARDLGISHRTVEIHRANMRARLGARTTGTMIELGVRFGLLNGG